MSYLIAKMDLDTGQVTEQLLRLGELEVELEPEGGDDPSTRFVSVYSETSPTLTAREREWVLAAARVRLVGLDGPSAPYMDNEERETNLLHGLVARLEYEEHADRVATDARR